MAFADVTLAQFRKLLANRLDYGDEKYWIEAELNALICEALQFWNVASLYFRDRVVLPTVASTAFYDLKDAVNGGGDKPLERTTTDREVVNSLQYSLVEAVNDFSLSSMWAGTQMFTMADLVSAVENRLNQFQTLTRRILYESSQIVTTGDGRVEVNVLEVERAVWMRLDGDGNETQGLRLLQTDDLTAQKQSPRWLQQSGKPLSYSIVETQPPTLQLIPAPNDTGNLYTYSVRKNTSLDVTIGVVIDLPSDLVQFVKWGALADLLSRDGQSRDPERAAYCQQRWTEGVELTKLYASIISAQINGVASQINSVDDFDSQSPRWQKQTGKPSVIGLMGLSLIGLKKVPDGIYSLIFDVVRNAILPVTDGGFIQVALDYHDVILDYAEHLALFKCGGQEFGATMPLYERMMKQASEYNEKLKANAQNFETLIDRSAEQEKDRSKRAA